MLNNLRESCLQAVRASRRSCRRQLWMYVLSWINFSLTVVLLEVIFNKDLLVLTGIGIIPFLWICIRRCHDVGHPWYFILIPFYILVLFFKNGEMYTNEWGCSSNVTYCPSDFDSLDDYYRWRDKRPAFKFHWVVQMFIEILTCAVICFCVYMVNDFNEYMEYESNTNYYDFHGSKDIRFYIPDNVSINDKSVRDILFLESDDGEALIYETADVSSSTMCCGIYLKYKIQGNFSEELVESIINNAEPLSSTSYHNFEFINKYLKYFKR